MIRDKIRLVASLAVVILVCLALPVNPAPESTLATSDPDKQMTAGSHRVLEPSSPGTVGGRGSGTPDDEHDDEADDEADDEDGDGPASGMETACCGVDACVDSIDPHACESMGGAPFGLCSDCDSVDCPNPGCIGATGSCGEIHPTPGCEFLPCCTQICAQDPYCCEVAWDASCIAANCIATADEVPCCSPDGTCGIGSSSLCRESGGVVRAECLGDGDADGVDDGCTCLPPSQAVSDL